MANNPFTASNPFSANINKSNQISNNNPNLNQTPVNNNFLNILGSKPSVFGSNLNNQLFNNNFNIQQNTNKEDNKDNQEIKPNPFPNDFNKPDNTINSKTINPAQNNPNQGVFGNSLQSAPQNNVGIFQNKDSNQGTFNKQFSFSTGNDAQPNSLFDNAQNNPNSNFFGNPNNNNNNLMNNQKKETVEDKNQNPNKSEDSKNTQSISSVQGNSNKNEPNNPPFGQNLNVNKNLFGSLGNDKKPNMFSVQDNKITSSNSFSQPIAPNKDSDKVQKIDFNAVDKKTEKANENIINKSNLALANNDSSKPQSNNLNKDSKDLLKNTGIHMPSEQIKENRTIEDFKIDKLMSLSIDDLINKWKLELDNQVDKFEKAADSIKNFELNFQNQYDKVGHLSELINKITENGENTLNELTNISKEEDYIIDQLDCMEKNLDKFFDIVSKNTNQNDKSLSIDDKIYSSALELDSNIKEIQTEIDSLQNNFNVQSENHARKVENLKSFQEKNSGASFDVKFKK